MARTVTPERHLYLARACLLGARERLATFRRLGALNSNDRDLHAKAEDDFRYALDLVWEAQLACNPCETCDAPTANPENEYGEFVCESCEQNAAESAYERHCEDFHDGGCTRFNSLRDQQIEAMKLK